MKNKYFEGANKWQENDVETVGLPRPWATSKRKDLAKKFPIPWQSGAKNDQERFLKIIQENEDIVYYKNLCSYCGIKINNEENVVRWKSPHINKITHSEHFLFSDIHPLHLECMRQTRIYCPGMRKRIETEF